MREIAGAENGGTTELTMAGQVLGTPYYMSPEQWGEISRDGNFEIDGRADIYSLGLVAYQMITGKRAYSGGTLHELRREHLAVHPAPLREVMPDVSGAFSEAITRAIAKDRGDRQPTAGQLAAELRAAIAGAPASPGATMVVPPPQAGSGNTNEIPSPIGTQSDVNAATIVTSEALNTGPVTGSPVTSAPASRHAAAPAAGPHFAPVDDMSSSVTVQRQPAAPVKSRGKSLALVGAGALVLSFGRGRSWRIPRV